MNVIANNVLLLSPESPLLIVLVERHLSDPESRSFLNRKSFLLKRAVISSLTGSHPFLNKQS